MDELKTQRTREIIHVILDFMGVRRRSNVTSAASLRPSAHSPYDNLSLTQSLGDESFSIDLEFGSANTSRARSANTAITASNGLKVYSGEVSRVTEYTEYNFRGPKMSKLDHY
jgi:hypothetical protein